MRGTLRLPPGMLLRDQKNWHLADLLGLGAGQIGALMDRGHYSTTFYVAAAVLLLSVVAASGVGRRVRG